jgi:hypothetical protein
MVTGKEEGWSLNMSLHNNKIALNAIRAANTVF